MERGENIMKKLMSLSVSLMMLLSMIPTNVFAVNETEYENQQQNLFTYSFTEPTAEGENGKAVLIGLVDNYKELLGGSTELILPNVYVNAETGVKYNCELNSAKTKFLQENDYITKVTLSNLYKSISGKFCFNATAMKTISFKYSGDKFRFNANSLSGCTSLEKIYVYAESLYNVPLSTVFTNVPVSAIAYVKNETVKEQLVNWPGQIVVDPNMSETPVVSIDKTNLTSKIAEVEAFFAGVDDESDELRAALANAKTVNENNSATQEEVNSEYLNLYNALKNTTKKVDKTALSSKITEAETFLAGIDKSKYNNVAALETAIANAKAVNENASATQIEVDNEVTALTSALSNVKLTDKTELVKWINYYEKILGEIDKTTYTNVEAFEAAFAHAKTVNNSDTATQEEVDKEIEDLNAARDNMKPIVNKTALKEAIDKAEAFKEGKLEIDYDNFDSFTTLLAYAKNDYNSDKLTQKQLDDIKDKLIAAQEAVTKADVSEEKAQLDKLIEQAESFESYMFTEESWAEAEKALTEAKAINDGLKSEYNAAIEKLRTALEGLSGIELPTVSAGKPFAKVYPKGRTATVVKTTADKDMANATKIRVTFDCADDVSYNPNASIEIKAVVGGKETYKKFIGTDSSYKNGETWSEELVLTDTISEGDDVELSAFTYAWDNAKDYVYGITKVEFINIAGSVIKSYNDRIFYKEELENLIAEAEKIDTKPYSSESAAELTKAIESAKALTDEATADELNSAINAINAAIKNLKEPVKPSVTASSTPEKPQPTKPTASPTTKAARSADAVKKDKTAAEKIMKQAKIKKLTAKSKAKKKISVTWKKVKKAVGYQVQISAKKNFKKTILNKLTTKKKLTIKSIKLKSGKKYFVRVRAYATYKDANNNAVKVYSKWNKKLRKVTVR